MSQLHKCSTCEAEFGTEEEYCNHTCNTGFNPTEVAHQDALTDGQFSMQSQEAIKRGEERLAEGK